MWAVRLPPPLARAAALDTVVMYTSDLALYTGSSFSETGNRAVNSREAEAGRWRGARGGERRLYEDPSDARLGLDA